MPSDNILYPRVFKVGITSPKARTGSPRLSGKTTAGESKPSSSCGSTDGRQVIHIYANEHAG